MHMTMRKTLALLLLAIPLCFSALTAPVSANSDQTPNQDTTASARLENPLDNVTTLDGFLAVALNLILAVAWAIAAFFLILSGFRFVQAQGNPEKLELAKKTFLYTIIGIAVIAGANAIVLVLQDLLQEVAQ